MEANSLFKTRQLTSYRNWSNNKKGCLFYVPDDGFFDNGRGGIYFMTNAFWREGEKEGECNHLHPFEYTLLKNHCVVRGYAAFLILQGWNEKKWERDASEYWNIYNEWCNEVTRKDWEILSPRIAVECDHWLSRDNDILQECVSLEKINLNELGQMMLHTIALEATKMSDSIETLMWDTGTIIKLDGEDSKSDSYVFHKPKVDGIILCNVKNYRGLTGFQANIINYFAAHYTCEKIISAYNSDDAAIWMCIINGINRMTERHYVSFSDFDYQFKGLDIEAVYNCYDQKRRNILSAILKEKSSYVYGLPESEKKSNPIHEELHWEIVQYKEGIPFEQYLPETAKLYIRHLSFHFYYSLLQQLKDTNYYLKDTEKMKTLFPEEMEDLVNKDINSRSQSVELFKYIHYSVESEEERKSIHNKICKIVKYPQMSVVCDNLRTMIKEGKILGSIQPEAMLAELRRLGLPNENVRGFSNHNFFTYYAKK